MKEYPGSAFLTPFSFRQTNKLLKVLVNGFVSKKFPHHPVPTCAEGHHIVDIF